MTEQKNHISPWLLAGRVIFTFALIGCITFIFTNSMQVAAVSEGASGRVLERMQQILRMLGLNGVAHHLTMHIVRKLAHFCEYMLEGFLLMLCLRVYTRHLLRHVSWPILGGLLTALTDETVQLFVPGRSGQVTDVWIDMAGVIAGLFVALIILLILRATMAFYQVKRENKALRAEQEALRQREHERLARRAAHRAAQGEDNNEEEDEA